jgi:hypothetical protein
MIGTALDETGMAAMVRSIRADADYLDVTVHGGALGRARASIDEALAALSSGTAIAVRLSYRIRESAWSDTLTRAERGFRLLRVGRASLGYSAHGE